MANKDAVLYKEYMPELYRQKEKAEATLGRELTMEEFKEKYYKPKTGGVASGNSIFDPVLCELMYKWFCTPSGKILDPFSGGSVRGIVAATLGYDYTGIDIRPEQVDENQRQWEAYAKKGNINPTWICGDSTNSNDIAKGQYDMVFSCPPYADLEKYSDDPNDISTMEYDTFIPAYTTIIKNAVSMLKQDRFACFVVGDIRDKQGFYRNFPGDTIKAFQDAGAKLYNYGILITAGGSLALRAGSIFSKSRKLGKTHQDILVFYKGDPSKIKENYPDIETATEGE